MADLHRLYGSWARALAAFNWGPANVANWDGQRATLPEETRHYLDVILGDGWPEPAKNLTVEVPHAPEPLRVTDDHVKLRSKPGTDSTVLATLAAGWSFGFFLLVQKILLHLVKIRIFQFRKRFPG
jgi:hypothetical protein